MTAPLPPAAAASEPWAPSLESTAPLVRLAALARERPSRHGKIIGQFLSAVAEAGHKAVPAGMPTDMCSTCAFRDGAMPNQMAATGLVAFNIVMGLDSDAFACHHGMQEGVPQKLCVGYLLAKLAPWPEVQAEAAKLKWCIDTATGPDETRLEFDRWLDKVDPGRMLDDYALARLFARDASRAARSPDPRSALAIAQHAGGRDADPR